jgi:competence protein ComEA
MIQTITRSAMTLLIAALLLAGQHVAAAGPMNLNTATATELATLKGIGPAKAQAIIEHRDKNGDFKSVDDLKLVRGIGDKMLEELRPQLTVDGKTAGDAPPHPAIPKP